MTSLTSRVIKRLFLLVFPVLQAQTVFAHLGPHTSSDCFIAVDSVQLRLNGYQFHSNHPEKHYCRYFPKLGDVIINIDSEMDIGRKEISLQWLEIKSPLRFFGKEKIITAHKATEWKTFSGGMHILRRNIDRRGLYGLRILLKSADGNVEQNAFYFLVGIPVVLILVVIASLVLLIIALILIKQLKQNG